MNNRNFQSISELQEYINRVIKLSSENIFHKYLSKIFSNLLQREEKINDTKNKLISRDKNSPLFLLKDSYVSNLVPDKIKQKDLNISLNTFLDYINIQEFIGEKIYKYLKGEKKSEKLSKNEFCEGLNRLYYGNINDLINFTFFLADFNNKGKIYKTDMKLILAYIPCISEFSQKNYVKQINKIINNFFDDKLNKDEILYEGNEQQLNLEIFQKYINEYHIKTQNKSEKQFEINSEEFLNDYDYNAPFFYFISIISYLFKNLPFNPKTVEYFNNFNNKKKIKVGIMALDKNGMETMRKNLINTESKLNNNFFSTKSNSFFKSNLLSTAKRNSINNNYREIKEALPKIGRTNLFSIKKSGSQIFLKKDEVQKGISNVQIIKKENKNKNISRSTNKNEFLMTQRKGFSNRNLPNLKQVHQQNEISLGDNNFRRFKKVNINKKISPVKNDNLSESTTKNTSLLFLNKSNSNDIREKFINLRQKLPAIYINQKKYSPRIGLECNLKLKEEIKNNVVEPDEFILCEYSDNDDENRNSLCGRDSNKSDNIFQLNEAYLYRYSDNDLQPNILNKYYALIKEKEILFFSSDQKTDLNDIWYINKSYISTGREIISKKNYYTINITFENNFVKKLYFLNENICQSFSLSIKNTIKDYNFNDYYDLMNTVGEGHFGKVSKCKNKKSGDIYAVKIINKAKTKPNDINLIRQEKNYLNLIKHENIIKLIDFFEDKQNIYLVTEFYQGGDLLTYIELKQRIGEEITEKNCARIIRKIAVCINYLNFFGIIHRDLKPENIMFANPYDFKTLKLIDLGVCQTLSYGEKAKDSIGTNGYISPEIYFHSAYSFKIDVWSLGIVLYLLSTGGILPFDDQDLNTKNLARKVCYLQQEYPKEYFGNKSKRLINLLDKMLEKNENKRISINNLLKDCWFDIIKK